MNNLPSIPLKTQIYTSPHKVELNDIGTKKSVKRADDKFLIISSSGFNFSVLYYTAFFLSVFALSLCLGQYIDAINVGVSIVVFILIPLVVRFILTPRKRELIFNRMEGTLTVRRIVKKQRCDIVKPFNEFQFLREEVKDNVDEGNFHLMIANTDSLGGDLIVQSKEPMEWLSLYVWYMDKNRTLPPGTAFDIHRERDYERRKNEGFLQPIYPSAIETPEWAGAAGGDALRKYKTYIAMLQKKYKNTLDSNNKSYKK